MNNKMNCTVFISRQVKLTDGSDLYEVITPMGERIASFVGETADEDSYAFADALNEVCSDATELLESDVVINA